MLPKRHVRVATQRNNPLNDYLDLYGWLKGSIVAQMHFHALSKLPFVVACSRAIVDTNRNSRRNLTAKVVRNGVDLSSINSLPTINEKQAQRRQLNLPVTGRLFIYAGPLIRRKEPELLVRAFLDAAKPQDTLVLLGDGPLLANCRQLAKDATNILLPGLVDCVETFLRAADFFVSASRAEGMPNAALEALSASLPVILSDIPPHQEILAFSPKAGWQFELGNQRALAEKIERVKTSLEHQHAARRLVEQHFDAKTMSNAYQRLYLEAIKMDKLGQ
jgi:glycosyltransferase involved in cell wall biosynthesis